MAPLLYLLLTVISVLTLARLWSTKQYSVQDGFLFGGLYFFLIPSGLTLILGPIEAEGLFIAPYTGLRLDIACFVALSMLPLIAFSLIKPVVVHDSYDDLLRLQAYFVLSMSVAIAVFLFSGKMEGKHWADASTTDSPLANALAVVLLALRTYMFALGMIVLKRHKSALFYLVVFAATDILLTGNRIAALYLAVAVLFSGAFRMRTMLLAGIVLAAPTALFLSLYPALRGVLWTDFGGLPGLWDAALYVFGNFDPQAIDARYVWYFFEAANLSVFQYIFDTYGHATDLVHGSTVLLKPIGLFIPREIWPDKPEGLGIRLGPEIAGVEGLSLNSLLLGEFWANFAWGAPVAFIAMLLLVTLVYRLPWMRRPDIARFGFLLGFASWRHEFNYFVFATIAGVLVIALTDPVVNKAMRRVQ